MKVKNFTEKIRQWWLGGASMYHHIPLFLVLPQNLPWVWNNSTGSTRHLERWRTAPQKTWKAFFTPAGDFNLEQNLSQIFKTPLLSTSREDTNWQNKKKDTKELSLSSSFGKTNSLLLQDITRYYRSPHNCLTQLLDQMPCTIWISVGHHRL